MCVNKPPGLATQGGTKTNQHLDRLLDGLAGEAGPPQTRPSARQGYFRGPAGGEKRAFGRPFRKSLLRENGAQGLLGAGGWGARTEQGVIDAPLAKQPGTGGEKMHVDPEHGLPAKTRWRIIDRAGNRAAWVELQPLTGRTHQLRAHMAAIGHPIVGDANTAARRPS